MKILMFGRGVISTIYGWALEQAGNSVEFHVRPGRTDEYGEAIELDLLDCRRRPWGQRIKTKWPVQYRETLEPDHDYDLIVVSVAHHRLPEAAKFLAPRLGKATLLVLGNVWDEPQAAMAGLPLDRVTWGFPGAGGGFGKDGVLRGGLFPSLTLGTLGQPPNEREHSVRKLFRDAGLRFSEQHDMRGWLWIHFIADVGVHTQGLKAGTLSQMAGSAGKWREALRTSRELVPLLQARGVDLQKHRSGLLLFRAPSWLMAAIIAGATAPFLPSGRSLREHTDPQAQEPRKICRDALAEARRQGIAAPRLELAEPYFREA